MDFFIWRDGGHHKTGLVLGSFICILGSFLQVKVQNGIFCGLLKFQICIWDMSDISDILLWYTVDAWSKSTYQDKMRVPPWEYFQSSPAAFLQYG